MGRHEIIDRPPRTIMEVYKMLPEGTLAELIDGVIYMSPSPISNHQRVLTKLSASLHDFLNEKNLGELFVAPLDVYLDENSNAIQPDIIFVASQNSSIVKDHIHGVPDMLIEILSPSNKDYDRLQKKELYERFGVKEYWIIDPATKEAIGYKLNAKNQYEEFSRSTAEINSVLLNRHFAF